MSNIHGKGAIAYLGAVGAAAIQIGEQVDYSIDFDMALVDTTSLGLLWKVFVKGLMGYSGTLAGNFDPSSVQLWNASTSTVAEKFYLYPQASVPTSYYYGTVWVQLTKILAGSMTAKASNGVKLTGNGPLLMSNL